MAGHMFDDYFERDFVSGEAWWRDYGDATRPFTITGFAMRESWDKETRKTKHKPVMYLAEFGDKCVFLNRGMYDKLVELLGLGFEDSPKSRGVVLNMSCAQRNGGQGVQHVVSIVSLGEKKPGVGEETSQKFLELLGQNELGLSDFWWWLRVHHRQGDLAEDLQELDIADWPAVALSWMRGYADQIKSSPTTVRKP